MTTVVTGWTGRGYDALGNQFCQTFDRYWSPYADAIVYVDDFEHLPPMPAVHGAIRRLSACAGLAEFIERHKTNKAAHGRKPNERWKGSEVEAGYSYRFDAVKFATQMFIPEAAAKTLPDQEILAWFDADVVTRRKVPESFIRNLLGDDDLVYLGREPKHSEIGFWAVRLNTATRHFLTALAESYRSDVLFNWQQWHSAFVFDVVRRPFGLKEKNLTPGRRGHVWPDSPLGKYTEHLKGKRKLPAMKSAA